LLVDGTVRQRGSKRHCLRRLLAMRAMGTSEVGPPSSRRRTLEGWPTPGLAAPVEALVGYV
jgi:hypothetical protein